MLRRKTPTPRRQRERFGIERRPPRIFRRHRGFVKLHECLLKGHGDHVCSGDLEFAHCRHETDGTQEDQPSDWWGNPLCEGGHKWQHQHGEPATERKYGVRLKHSALQFAAASPDIAMKEAMAEMRRREPWMFEV